MIIPKANKLSKEQLKEIESIVGEFECNIQVITGAHKNIYAIIGDDPAQSVTPDKLAEIIKDARHLWNSASRFS